MIVLAVLRFSDLCECNWNYSFCSQLPMFHMPIQ